MLRSPGLVAMVLLLGACGSDDPPADRSGCTPADNVHLCGDRLLIAHRGGGRLRPEETLSAFDHAAELGADVLELDVHTTSDGEVVCLHDATVDRTTDGTGAVHALTLADVKALDAGYRFTTDRGETFPYRGQGITIPTLAEVLAAHPSAWFSIEIKQSEPDMVGEVLEVLDANDAADRVVLVSFDDAVVERVRALRPEIVTGMGAAEMAELLLLRDVDADAYVPRTTIAQVPSGSVDEVLVARAARYGIRLHAWTVNDRSEMTYLLDVGVHGIMTDDPALLAEVLAQRETGAP